MSATKKTYPLLHLSCAGCAAKVEQNLNKYPGVSKAAVNFASSVWSLIRAELSAADLGIK
jgi:Cu2+-exporting ATPase